MRGGARPENTTAQRERFWAAVAVVAVAGLLALAAWRALMLLRSGTTAGAAIGAAVLAIVAVGAWAVWRSVWFGVRMQRLARELADEGGLPADELPRDHRGRADRAAADAVFERRRAETEARPDDWRTWFRLALAYDDAGDRARARAAARTALDRRRQP